MTTPPARPARIWNEVTQQWETLAIPTSISSAWRGTYSAASTYAAGDLVYHSATGSSYIALAPSSPATPITPGSNAAVWDYVALKGDPGSPGPAMVALSPTPPASPQDGMVWIDSDATVPTSPTYTYAATPPTDPPPSPGDLLVLSAPYSTFAQYALLVYNGSEWVATA